MSVIPPTTMQTLWAAQAWVAGRWQQNVRLDIGADGHFVAVRADVAQPAGAQLLPGAVLPGMVNAHSHAFQRAFAGMAERRAAQADDFWSWRDRMYAVALRVSPEALEAIAAQLYVELLQGGYTQVCEFHYLHHDTTGSHYADPLTMSRALMRAAASTGIGLTLLPVLYERAGFTQPKLRDDQRRFATTPEQVIALRDGVRAEGQPHVNAGVAIHSLRAAAPASIARLLAHVGSDPAPIHVHVAEQTAEVDECVAANGCRPIEWLAAHVALDARWQLVHATHATHAEIDAVAASGAGVVICPSTEANLGDGIPDLPAWLANRAVLSIGSDSHVTRQWPAELRLLEYGQRLTLHRRNVAAAPESGIDATAGHLFQRCVTGGGAAAGLRCWGLEAGARADLLVLDPHACALLGVPDWQALDALVFAADAPAFSEVWVGGRRVLCGGTHADAPALSRAYRQQMVQLWAGSP